MMEENQSANLTPEGYLTLDQGGEAMLHVNQLDIDKILDENEGPMYIRQWLRINGSAATTINIDIDPYLGMSAIDTMIAVDDMVRAVQKKRATPGNPDEPVPVEYLDKIAQHITRDKEATYAAVMAAGLSKPMDGSQLPEFDTEAFMDHHDKIADNKRTQMLLERSAHLDNCMATLEAQCHPLMIEESEIIGNTYTVINGNDPDPVPLPPDPDSYLGQMQALIIAQGPREFSAKSSAALDVLIEASEKAYQDWEAELVASIDRPIPLVQYLEQPSE